MHVRENLCVLFNPLRLGPPNEKNAISRIICMTPQCDEILKNLAVKPASLPASTLLGEERTRERWFSEVCFERWKNMEVRFPRCFTEARTCPDVAHLCIPQRLVRFNASELKHYRSSRHHRNRLAKTSAQFSSHGLFLYKAVVHIQQHLKGVMQHQSKIVVYSFSPPRVG